MEPPQTYHRFVLIQGYDVIFDPDQSRVGFASSSCNYQSLSQ